MAALKLQKIKYRTATNTNTWNSFLDMCYPVGSIVHFINNTSQIHILVEELEVN